MANDAAVRLDADEALRQRARLDGPPKVDRTRHTLAATKAGTGAVALARALWQASRAPGRLTSDEYFYYRLYDPALSDADRRRYVGKRAQKPMHDTCNDARWYATADDKALFYTIMRGLGLPVPETIAAYERGNRAMPWPVLRDEDAVRRFLAEGTAYPVFAKPCDGMYSIGALDLAGIGGGFVLLGDGGRVTLDELLKYVAGLGRAGYLFQRRLKPHPVLAEHFGTTVGAARLLVLLGPDGPSIESAVVKIPRSANVADNFWRAGNMLGALDPVEGRILRAISGVGEDVQEHETHPETGAAIRGLCLPDWAKGREICLRAASAFPAIRTQSWDVALTDAGPVLLEFNFGGDLNLHQLAHRRGALSDRYIEHLRRCGYTRL
ncbi:MAG: hypothetical protein IT563_12475 [Alphaproteobacteria bacterium]|nr:hypothetical protein [Alphaproteobacteria bacterium]